MIQNMAPSSTKMEIGQSDKRVGYEIMLPQ